MNALIDGADLAEAIGNVLLDYADTKRRNAELSVMIEGLRQEADEHRRTIARLEKLLAKREKSSG